MTWLLSATSTFLWLLVMHALCDYALQSDDMILMKHPRVERIESMGPWLWTMSAHAGINAGGVALVTGSWLLGALEFIVHFGSDTLKCQGRITTYDDQAGHLLSKLVWAVGASVSA